MCTHTRTCTSTGTVHTVRALRARPFSSTPPRRRQPPHSVFRGFDTSKIRCRSAIEPPVSTTVLLQTLHSAPSPWPGTFQPAKHVPVCSWDDSAGNTHLRDAAAAAAAAAAGSPSLRRAPAEPRGRAGQLRGAGITAEAVRAAGWHQHRSHGPHVSLRHRAPVQWRPQLSHLCTLPPGKAFSLLTCVDSDLFWTLTCFRLLPVLDSYLFWFLLVLTLTCSCPPPPPPPPHPPEGSPGISDVSPLVWNLRAASLIPLFYILSPLVFFCLVLLLFLS